MPTPRPSSKLLAARVLAGAGWEGGQPGAAAESAGQGGDADMDIEDMLLTKIEQRTSGGPHELRRAFGVFDNNRDDGVGIVPIVYTRVR